VVPIRVNKKWGIKPKALLLIPTVLSALLITGVLVCQPVFSCYGPHITASVSATEIYINETVTVTGKICVGEEENPNLTVRVTFVRPDYNWQDQIIEADSETGEFSVTETLDMAGYWNVFPIYGHINDRLGVTVIDPSADPSAPMPVIASPWKPNLLLIVSAVSTVSIGAVFAVTGLKKKTRKISSLRLFIQVSLVFLIFAGMFVDHEILPVPASKIPVHEFLVGTNFFGVEMSDGFPVPFFGCYYPCGKTVTCALWELQTYIYPFWST
jgi:hypothetical protein